MRRLTAFFPSLIIAGFLLTATTPAFAASTPTAPTPEILPLQIHETVKPGQTITVPLSLRNTTSQDTVALIPAEDALLGGLAFPTQPSAIDSQWLPPGATSLKITSPSNAELSLSVPTNQAPGLYEAGVEIAEPAKSMSKASSTKVSAQINVIERIVAPIFVTVPGPVATAQPTLGIAQEQTAGGQASVIMVTNPAHSVDAQKIPVTLTISRNGQQIVKATETFSDIQPASTAVSGPIPWKFAIQPGSYVITASAPGLATVTKTETISSPKAHQANQDSSAYYHVDNNQPASIPISDLEYAGAGVGLLGVLIALLIIVKRRMRD